MASSIIPIPPSEIFTKEDNYDRRLFTAWPLYRFRKSKKHSPKMWVKKATVDNTEAREEYHFFIYLINN